jgi:hypothetical protein
MSQLSDKLKALGVSLGTSGLPARSEQKVGRGTLLEILPGDFTHLGTLFETEQVYAMDYQHGLHQLWQPAHNAITRLTGLDFKLQDLVFLDAETTGLSGGTGTFAFMIGLGWLDGHNNFKVRQIFLPEPGSELAFLTALMEELSPFTTVVSFNGKSFDIPLLNSRYVLHAMPSPFSQMAHIDLLHLARSIWRYRLSSRTLGDLETHILHFERGEEELPGWMAPKLYLEYLHSGDAFPLKGMFYHNQIDIVSLAALLSAIEHTLSFNVKNLLELFALAELFEKSADPQQAGRAYAETILMAEGSTLAAQARFRLGLMARRQENWQNAIAYWQEAADLHPGACVELAKYFEHQARDYETATLWCRKAITLFTRDFAPAAAKNEIIRCDLEHRLERLTRKMERKEEHDGQ